MAEELESVDISEQPELLRLAEDVARSGLARVLSRDGEVLAVIRPAPPIRGHASTKLRASLSQNAWLDGLIGAGQSDEPTAVSEDIHRSVADTTHAESHPESEPLT